jgi:hypothetical protein
VTKLLFLLFLLQTNPSKSFSEIKSNKIKNKDKISKTDDSMKNFGLTYLNGISFLENREDVFLGTGFKFHFLFYKYFGVSAQYSVFRNLFETKTKPESEVFTYYKLNFSLMFFPIPVKQNRFFNFYFKAGGVYNNLERSYYASYYDCLNNCPGGSNVRYVNYSVQREQFLLEFGFGLLMDLYKTKQFNLGLNFETNFTLPIKYYSYNNQPHIFNLFSIGILLSF